MKFLSILAAFLLALTGPTIAADAPSKEEPPSIAAFTSSMTHLAGFLTLHWDERNNRVYLEVPDRVVTDLLYQATLASGVGQVPLYLDRGSLGPTRLVTLRRFGSKALMIERNTHYFTPLAELDSSASFPGSVVFSFDVVAGSRSPDGTRYLVDATSFFLRDDIDVARQIKKAGRGTYQLECAKCVVDGDSIKVSSTGVEVQSLLTFTTSETPPKNDIFEDLVQDPNSILIRELHALVRLPPLEGSSYRPRAFDQRVGYFDQTFYDPSARPLDSMRRSVIKRHHLAKKNAYEAVSEPQRPIIFYIDPSVPPELRGLVREAADWWNVAFETAGFRNALQVMDLPAELNPLSIGVNSILWIQRSTRGFSFGDAVADPRTGEILKATIRLDAMRLRADRLLLDAITNPYSEHPDFSNRDEALRQRFKLLIAHEMGHTLGLRHQYAGSSEGNSSVMDYPFPNIGLTADGAAILRDVFPQGLGAWDKLTIQYGYKQIGPEKEAAELREVADDLERNGLYWQSDGDTDDAQPYSQRWDRGTDPIAELNKVMLLRRVVLARFSKAAIAAEEPLAALQDALTPAYLLHQFAIKPVAAMLSGFDYRYALRDQPPPTAITPDRQRQAIDALLSTLDPEALSPGPRILQLMSPRPVNYAATAESFGANTGVIFDAAQPIEIAAALTMKEILKPTRAARLAQAAARDPQAPGLGDVLTATINYSWKQAPKNRDIGMAQRTIATVVVQSILATVGDKDAAASVKAACWLAIDDLEAWMRSHPPEGGWREVYALTFQLISETRRDPSKLTVSLPKIPQLAPMGSTRSP